MSVRTLWILILCAISVAAEAQAELEAWGNLRGIRVEGQLMELPSQLRLVRKDGSEIVTGQERQHPKFRREGDRQIVNTQLDSIYISEEVQDAGRGTARITLRWEAHADMELKGVWISFDITGLDARDQKLTLTSDPLKAIDTVKEHDRKHLDIELAGASLNRGQQGVASILIRTDGPIDRGPVQLTLDPSRVGRAFDGLGGNFRIQNPSLDPAVIAYCLDHMRVAWGRVELPWHFWQVNLEDNPLDSARAGALHPAVKRAMDMARDLGVRHIPVIVSAWFPPQWAVQGPLHYRPGPDHIWGNALDPAKTDAIYKSIADYVIFLKEKFGVEARYFSFNESDLGINVRQTAVEHRDLIKGLGAYFASRGLATRVLLGDNSDATTYRFIDVAMEDPAAKPYLGAISFHSWRGWDSLTLSRWAEAATRLRLPLLVGEGSIDAAAWNYPAIFQEPVYALREIELYVRLLAICQPASILQWQLTTDYSPLAGGGIFGDKGELRPTQRFYNLQQLSMTPSGLFALPITSDHPTVTAAGLGDKSKGIYVVHLVNNGAARPIILRGLPGGVKSLRVYSTNQTDGVKEGAPIKIVGGVARFEAAAASFVTVMAMK